VGTGFAALTSEFSIVADNTAGDGTMTTTATAYTVAFATSAATVNSATSTTITGTITVTADSKTKANVLAAAGTYSLGINVKNAELDSDITAGIVAFSTGSGVQFADPTQLVSKVSNSNISQVVGGQANLLFRPTASSSAARYAVTVTGATMRQAVSGATGTTKVYYTDSGNAIDGTNAGTYGQGITIAGDVDSNDALTDVDTITISFSSATAGVSTVSFTPISSAGVPGTATTALITWVASADSYGNSTVTKVLGTSNFSGTTYYASAAASANAVATFSVVQNDTAGVALASASLSKAVVVTLTGTGSLAVATGGATTGVIATPAAAWPNDGTGRFSVFGNGTAGTGTLSVAVNGVTIWTKTIIFYGTPTSVVAEASYTIARAGGYEVGDLDHTANVPSVDNTPAIAVSIKDALGNVVPTAAVFVSSNPAAIVSTPTDSFIDSGTGQYSAGFGVRHVTFSSTAASVSGQSSDITFTHTLASGVVLTSNVIKATVGGTRTGGSVAITLDKATYEPGERMILTFTAKDSAGNPVHDRAATGTPASNKNASGLSSAGDEYVGGKHVYGDGATEFLYAPTTPGAFTLTLASGTATGAVVSTTATVGDDAATTAAAAAGDAAAEATDAANAATDAANAAAEAADAATAAAQDAADAVAALSASVSAMVSDLKKQITSLTNLVIKIQRKVRA
jgi:trimeric autotransporter adhesin